MRNPFGCRPGGRLPLPPWREWRHWPIPASECPMLDAHLWVHSRTGDARFVVTSDLGLYYWCPAEHPVRWGLTHEQETVLVAKFVRSAVRRSEQAAMQKSSAGVLWESAHPAIWEYLTLDVDDEGQERVTSMLCVFVESGVVKIALQDRQEGQSLWVASASLVEALAALEARLQAGDGEWRQSRGQQAQKSKTRR